MAVSKISVFNPETDDVESWTSVLQCYLIATGVDKAKEKEKAVAILLSAVGVSTYTLLKDLVSPAAPESKGFDDLVLVLKNHFKPAPKAISERFRFFNRRQKQGESVTVFLSALRKLASSCKFDNLDVALRDQFVVGLASETAQKLLFMEDDDLKLENAVKIAISQEAADASTKMVRQGDAAHVLATHKVSSGKSGQKSKGKGDEKPSSSSEDDGDQSCRGCGSRNHTLKDCPSKDVECYKCHEKGHYAKLCFKVSALKAKRKGNSIHNLKEESAPPPIFIDVLINGRPVELEWDTGTGRTLIGTEKWKELGSPKLEPSKLKFETYLERVFNVKGKLDADIEYNGQRIKHTVYVTKKNTSCLFGRDLLFKLQMDWTTIKDKCQQIDSISVAENLESLLEEFEDAPVGTARPVPFALSEKVDGELMRMEEACAIIRIEHLEWDSPLYPLAREDDQMETISGGNSFSKLDESDKNGLDCKTGDDVNLALCDFLLTYRISPHATTGASPSELFLEKPRTLLDLIRPDADKNVRVSHELEVESQGNFNLRLFEISRTVWTRRFSRNKPPWLLKKIVDIRGPVTHIAKVEGRMYKRHLDRLLAGEIVKFRPSVPALEQEDEELVLLDPEPEVEVESDEDPVNQPDIPEPERRRQRRAPVRYPEN